MASVRVLGVRVDNVTLKEAVAQAAQLLATPGAQSAHQIATVNPEFIMAARHNPMFMSALEHTALNVPDGIGVLWAARRAGHALRERVAGVELTLALCEHAAHSGMPVYLLGAADGVAARAADALCARYPGLRVVGAEPGSPDPNQDASLCARIRAAHPAFVFVAYGAPKQDLWLARNLSALVDPASMHGIVGMGVGGTFDFMTGVQHRAPGWLRDIGLEWLYRLIRQPSRWRRQLALVRFVYAVLRGER
jgi:N-acetylglucosaminyldiphosphoundecaprenol N-acetyl-beta-D-mannosaminyltransferase